VKRLRVDHRGGFGAFRQKLERMKAKETENKHVGMDFAPKQAISSN